MANNKIQVKRTSTSGRTPNTTNSGNAQYIAAGELALNMADGILYTSNGSVLIPVGANQTSINITTSASLPGQTANTTGFYPVSNTSGSTLGNSTARWSMTALDISTSTLTGSTIGVTRLYTTATSSSFEANSYTTGNILLGGVNQTGYILVGQSTNNQTVSIANGATISGNTKTISIGQNGAAGSQTNITVGSSLSNTFVDVYANSTAFSGTLTLNNDKSLRFKTVNTSAYATFVQQSDDNFVFYTTNASYGQRPVFSIYANSNSSDLSFSTTVRFNANVAVLTANGTQGSPGQVLASNGSSVYWVSPSAASVNTSAQWTWSNTHTFQANVAFTGNNISVVSNTGSVMFGGAGDTNWRIGRSTGSTTKFFYSNNTLDILAADSNLEGVVIGKPGGNTYLETGYAGTFTLNPIYVGNSSVNVSINSTSFSGTSNNALRLGGLLDTSYLRSDASGYYSGGVLRFTNDSSAYGNTTSEANTLQIYQPISGADAFQTFHVSGDTAVHFGLDGTTNDLFVGGWSFGANKYKVWHQNNDGAGSGLDADTLDGQHGSYYAANSQLANYALLAGANFTGNVTANNANTVLDLNVGRNLTVAGNLTITGNVTVVGANTLEIVDNFIYLNSNNSTQNEDIGIAGNYNDGTYRHTGFFRDATDGFWKVFDSYEPEPDASVNIDTSNLTFKIADFWANTVRVGNTSVYSTINTTSFSGTANNASYLGGIIDTSYLRSDANDVFSGTYLNPSSNTILLGNSTARWVITANSVTTQGQVANATGLYPTSNTVGDLLGNTTSRWDMFASTIDMVNWTANATGLYPTSNTAGDLLGNTTARWDIFAINGDFAGNVAVNGLIANGSLGTAKQVLYTDGTKAYWGTALVVYNAAGTQVFP